MASSVDLPAPLGPISPVSVPRRTQKETSITALTPPNSRDTLTASSTTGLGPGASGVRGRPTGTGGGAGAAASGAATTRGADAAPSGVGPAAAGAARADALCARAVLITRLRSGRMPCGRTHRKITISRPIATHSSDGIRFGGRLLDVGMYRVTSSKPTGTRIAPRTAPRRFPAPPMITAANSTTVSAYPQAAGDQVVI